MKTRRWAPAVALAMGLALSGCALFDALLERINILGMDFSFRKLDVRGLVFPGNWTEISLDLVAGNRSALAKYGVDVRCAIAAANPNAHPAVFDGAVGHLRVSDTSAGASHASANLPAFSVRANADTVINVVFPLRLDNPVFSKTVWGKIVRGEDIPYKLDADMIFALVGQNGYGGLDTLGTKPVQLNLVTGTVDVKETGLAVLDRFLALLELVF